MRTGEVFLGRDRRSEEVARRRVEGVVEGDEGPRQFAAKHTRGGETKNNFSPDNGLEPGLQSVRPSVA
jgi:hypothetical protein